MYFNSESCQNSCVFIFKSKICILKPGVWKRPLGFPKGTVKLSSQLSASQLEGPQRQIHWICKLIPN